MSRRDDIRKRLAAIERALVKADDAQRERLIRERAVLLAEIRRTEPR